MSIFIRDNFLELFLGLLIFTCFLFLLYFFIRYVSFNIKYMRIKLKYYDIILAKFLERNGSMYGFFNNDRQLFTKEEKEILDTYLRSFNQLKVLMKGKDLI